MVPAGRHFSWFCGNFGICGFFFKKKSLRTYLRIHQRCGVLGVVRPSMDKVQSDYCCTLRTTSAEQEHIAGVLIWRSPGQVCRARHKPWKFASVPLRVACETNTLSFVGEPGGRYCLKDEAGDGTASPHTTPSQPSSVATTVRQTL